LVFLTAFKGVFISRIVATHSPLAYNKSHPQTRPEHPCPINRLIAQNRGSRGIPGEALPDAGGLLADLGNQRQGKADDF
jgi:hypothetical protein